MMKTFKCCSNKLESCHELFYLVLLLNNPLTGNLFINRTLRNLISSSSYFVLSHVTTYIAEGKRQISVLLG